MGSKENLEKRTLPFKPFIAGLAVGIFFCLSIVASLEYMQQDPNEISRYVSPLTTTMEKYLSEKPNKTVSGHQEATTAFDTGRVIRVIDGDTVDIVLSGERQRVRYIGINTPERNEPCYEQATQANIDLVLGKTVRLVKDKSDTDRYGRLLRYLFVDDIFVNKVLVEQGLAEAVLYKPDDQYYNLLSDLEGVAAEAGLGCHIFNIFDDGDPKR